MDARMNIRCQSSPEFSGRAATQYQRPRGLFAPMHRGAACCRETSVRWRFPCRARVAPRALSGGSERRVGLPYTAGLDPVPGAEPAVLLPSMRRDPMVGTAVTATTAATVVAATAGTAEAADADVEAIRGVGGAEQLADAASMEAPAVALPPTPVFLYSPSPSPSPSSSALSSSASASAFAAADVPSSDGNLSMSTSMSVSVSIDEEPEMCTLVAVASGDVQMLCESDPTHPVSLAEEALLHPIIPTTLLQDIEAKLEADLTTIAVTILFAVGFVSLEFGVNDLIEHYWGDSLLSDLVCAFVGLAVVFWVRLSKMRIMRFDRWR